MLWLCPYVPDSVEEPSEEEVNALIMLIQELYEKLDSVLSEKSSLDV